MEFKNLSSEQQERARTCKTPDDVLALAREVGYELSDEELKGISGGGNAWDEIWECPRGRNLRPCSLRQQRPPRSLGRCLWLRRPRGPPTSPNGPLSGAPAGRIIWCALAYRDARDKEKTYD